MLDSVYVLYHTRVDESGYEDDKCLGIFSSPELAEEAKSYALQQKGFRDHPDGFCISKYKINKREWLEGFGD